MSLREKVAAIVGALGMPPDMAAIQAISAACELLVIAPESTTPLPQIADELIGVIGCDVAPAAPPPPAAPPVATVAPAAAQAARAAAANSSSPPSARALGKRSASMLAAAASTSPMVPPNPKATKQATLFNSPGFKKLLGESW